MKKLITIISIINFFLVTSSVGAATFFFDPVEKNILEKEKITLSLYINPDKDFINAIDGIVKFDQNKLEVIGIDYTDSIISAWIEKPEIKNNKIIFSGIIPGGFNGVLKPLDGNVYPGILFNITFEAVGSGDTIVGLEDVVALKNDGLATEVESSIVPSVINIDPQNSRTAEYFTLFIGIIVIMLIYRKRKKNEIS